MTTYLRPYNRSFRPTIAVTCGDPVGIGPEIIVKALSDPALRNSAHFLIFGLNELLLHAADLAEIEPFWSRMYRSKWTTQYASNVAPTVPCSTNQNASVIVIDDDRGPEVARSALTRPPAPSKEGGAASLAFIRDALEATRFSVGNPWHVDAVVTAPISKTSWNLAGMKRFPGHTELFADFAKAKRFAMMFVAPERQLRVILATIHLPLMDLRNVMTIGKVFDPIDLADNSLRADFAIPQPRIAVCGLNPHASENGLFGDEEYRVIEPAIRQAVALGMNVQGPFPADTVFNAAIAGKFDAVIAMYHDQGTIPIKLLARDEAVNITLGLPFIRTSPDHGTAFDIAGRNLANPGSMRSAFILAVKMAARRHIRIHTHE